jgi:hypothetical protein
MSRVLKARLACVLLIGLLLALASGASAASEAASAPDLAAMALAGSDFPGGKVARQRFVKPDRPATATYSRVFTDGTRLGSARLLMLENEMSLFASPAVAAKQVQEFRGLVSTRRGREAFGEAIASGFRQETKAELKRVVVSTPISLAAGQSSVHVATTFVLANNASFSVHLAFVQTDRVVALLGVTPVPGQKVTRSHLRLMGRLQAERLREGFTVANTAAPAVTGTAAVAQALTVSSGDWSGAPSAYAYQWSRCDSTATACADIAGATAAAYTVAPEDTGSVLRATVTAKNSVSSATTVSAVTSPVA